MHPRAPVHRACCITALTALIIMASHAWMTAAPAHADAPAARARDHDIRLPDRDQTVTGEMRALSLTIAPLPGHTISREGPLLIDLAAEPAAELNAGPATAPAKGLHLPRQRYLRRDAADARAEAPRFDLRYRADTAGRHTLNVDLRFWVCTRRTCRPVRASRTVIIEATGDAPGHASAPPAPASQ